VNRRWVDLEIALHVDFGRRPPVQPSIRVDKRQVLALLLREGFGRQTHQGHAIQLFVRASSEEAQMKLRYRVELSQAERDELKALLSPGKHPVRKLMRAQILMAADAGTDEDIAISVGAPQWQVAPHSTWLRNGERNRSSQRISLSTVRAPVVIVCTSDVRHRGERANRNPFALRGHPRKLPGALIRRMTALIAAGVSGMRDPASSSGCRVKKRLICCFPQSALSTH
jgi:hypothetical protein